jgi:hypothetical protein
LGISDAHRGSKTVSDCLKGQPLLPHGELVIAQDGRGSCKSNYSSLSHGENCFNQAAAKWVLEKLTISVFAHKSTAAKNRKARHRTGKEARRKPHQFASMVFRAQPLAFWAVLAAALCLCSWSAPRWTCAAAIAGAESLVALEQDYTVVGPSPVLFIRAVLNGGDVSPHKVSLFCFEIPQTHCDGAGKRQR